MKLNPFSVLAVAALFVLAGCDRKIAKQAEKAKPQVAHNADGTTLEQDNIRAYREEFSDPKAIKHLYVFNDQGDCLFYDTVRGKVTSGGKRLRPRTIAVGSSGDWKRDGILVNINGTMHHTGEVPAYDGTWGSSEAYIYWRNAAGQFRKLSLGAGMATMVTTAPMRAIKAKVIIETEAK